MENVVFTKHARERFDERWYIKHPKSNETIESIFDQAREDRSIFNDHQNMMSLYERYGFDRRYRFMVFDDMVFVGVEDFDRFRDQPCCVFVTVVSVNNNRSVYARSIGQERFNRKHTNIPIRDNVSYRRLSKMMCHSAAV